MDTHISLEKEMYNMGLVCLGAAIVLIPVFLFFLSGRDLSQSHCLFWTYFGLYCPGCGGTRSALALLHGHVLQALWYHPLVPYMTGLYLVFMLTWTGARFHLFGMKKGIMLRPCYLYGLLIVVVGNFFLKNILKICFGIVMI